MLIILGGKGTEPQHWERKFYNFVKFVKNRRVRRSKSR